MLPYRHLLLLLAPAAVLSAPLSDDATSTLETDVSLSQLPGFVKPAQLAPKGSYPPWENDHYPVLHLRADQAHEAIEIPADQMSGRIRVTYDPDLEANKESVKPATSPAPVSPLVKRGGQPNPTVGEGICATHTEPQFPGTTFSHAGSECRPEKDPRAYDVTCRSHNRWGVTTHLERFCPVRFICVQLPEPAKPPKTSQIDCRSEVDAKKASTSTVGGLIKTVTKFFASPKGYTKLHFDAFTFDRNAHQIQVKSIDMIDDGNIFLRHTNANAMSVDKWANTNGEAVAFQAYVGNAFVTLEWWWRKI
ncbi:hypothetical protein EG328_011475 [Venturia inaequalis]|uniref:Uncharacterized protein n=1 Tax=Venturia inaequalis TaxID=5025 RepID=A0A8H3Z6R0_VENIN|nr:hypothetical protein EG328_011475 [Venturia inaequalis]